MSFPAYPSYRECDPGRWGRLPSDWKTVPIKAVASWNDDVLADATAPDYELDYVEISDVQSGSGISGSTTYAFSDAPSRARRRVRDGDILVSTVRTYLRAIAPVRSPSDNLIVSTGFAVLRPTAIDPDFLAYAVETEATIAEIITRSVGVSYPAINASDLVSIKIPLPSAAEQAAIAAFLNRETAKIDALVAEQRRLIELLKEKRQAVISHAVTKGLDPTVPMKDSGVEWLGDVPAHWTLSRIKWAVQSIEQGWSPQCDGFPVQSADEWGVLKVGCVNGGTFRPQENKALPSELTPLPELGVRKDDILVSRANTRELVGSAAVVDQSHPRLMLCDKLYRLRVDNAVIVPAFLALCLQSHVAREAFELAATGASSSMVNIGQSVVMNLAMALPTLDEQDRILAFVQEETLRIDAMVATSEAAVSLLQERRAALISAAVTGKVDVRAVAPRQAKAA